MKTWILAISCLFMLSISPDKKGLEPGDLATHTEDKLQGTDQKTHSLSELKGEHGLLVIFSCNTCPFVVGGEQFPGWERQYNDLHKQATKAGVGMVLLNANEAKRPGDDDLEHMIQHAQEKAYSMPYVMDTDHRIADAWGARTTPHVFLFNSDMKLVFTGSIDNSWDTQRKADENYLSDALSAIEQHIEITVNNSQPRGCSIKRKK